MPRIQLTSYFKIRQIIGKKTLLIDAINIKELLEILVDMYPELEGELYNGEISKFYRLIINGRNINLLDGISTKLTRGDNVIILPAIGGG